MAYRIWVTISVLALFFGVVQTVQAAACPCSIWPATSKPAMADAGPDSAVELGVTFHADTNGFITGIRFYKSSANIGTHVGNLWSSNGVLLATAIFSGESASGWQQVSFSTPVAITANTNYVASYHANSGHYSDDDNFFATSGVDNSPLHASASGSAGVNGRYAYGSTSSFPTNTYMSGNYWVDVVFTAASNTNTTTAPAITSQPANQSVASAQTATFSVAASGSAPLAYQWRKNGVNIASANSSTYTTPPATATDSGAQFSVVVSNSMGSLTSANAALSVGTVSSCPCSIWKSTDVPAKADVGADAAVELGVTFHSDSNGYITGVRFYKSAANTGAHVGNLWNSSGALLATATFSAESASGWQQVNFASPVAVTANTTYVASYHVNAGHYAYDSNFFATSGVDQAPLHAPLNGNGSLNGRYAYGSGSSFPNQNWSSANYWVDVVFATSANTTPSAPVISSQPAGATVAAGQSATFSIAVSGTAPLTYQWRKNGANISGANSSTYTTPATVSTDSGSQYSVVVGNSVGSVTSASAMLTVSATTRLLTANPTSLSFGNVSVSLNKVLTATFTNTGTSTVTISGVSMSGAGISISGISTGQMIAPSQSAAATIIFLPAITGSLNGSLTVSSNATNSPSTVALSGTAVNLITHSTSLGWAASVSSVVGYNVYSGLVSGGPYTKLTSSPVSAVTYKDSTVQSGKTYFYVVTAINSSGAESGYSGQATAAIP